MAAAAMISAAYSAKSIRSSFGMVSPRRKVRTVPYPAWAAGTALPARRPGPTIQLPGKVGVWLKVLRTVP
jgi:hypothetical protein